MATRTAQSTSTLKITKATADRIAEACRPTRSDPSERFGPAMGEWSIRLLKAALAKAAAGKNVLVIEKDHTERPITLRLPRAIVKRLGIVGSITGRSVSSMVEEKLGELLEAM